MRIKIRVWKGDINSQEGQLIELEGNEVMVGRVGCDLTVADIRCSRQHALFFEGKGKILKIRDLDSRNGTWLDGRRVIERAVPIGSIFRLGNVFLQVLEYVPSSVVGTWPDYYRCLPQQVQQRFESYHRR